VLSRANDDMVQQPYAEHMSAEGTVHVMILAVHVGGDATKRDWSRISSRTVTMSLPKTASSPRGQ
jgi:hypothetical protein